MGDFPAEDADVDSWRQIHSVLLKAVHEARQSVAAQKAQRRFWLEELCSNLTDDGTLSSSSVWKRPAVERNLPSASKPPPIKRKKKEAETLKPQASKKPRKKKSEQGPGVAATAPAMPASTKRPADSEPGMPKKRLKLKIPTKPKLENTGQPSQPMRAPPPPDYYAAHIPGTQAYHVAAPLPGSDHHAPPHHQWQQGASQGAPNLQLMAAVAFGASPAGYSPHGLLQHPPPPRHYGHHYYPQHHGDLHVAPSAPALVPRVSRTYASIQDVGESDDDSDPDDTF